ncbi:MAG: glycosyltransferase family 4 protein [Candidatus Onthomonas sp.]
MNICFLEGDMSRQGGTERMTSMLSNTLSETYQVFVISLKLTENRVFFSLAGTVSHAVLSPAEGKPGILSQICQIHRFLLENRIDRVINVDTGMSIYGIPASWGTKAKVITWEHANYFNNWGSSVFPYIRRFAARHSDAMVVLTEQDKINYETHIRSKVPVYAIANPVQPHTFHYDTASRIILSAGALLPIKGYDRAVDVAKRVLPSHPEWRWVICGEGPERQRLELLIREAGLEKQMLLAGTVRDMEAQYRAAAMVVMTSHMEGLPMVLLEAKSYGLPLISFDIMTGPRDIIADRLNGYLISPGDVASMAAQISVLMDDEELRASFSTASSNGMEKFEWKRVLDQWETLLVSL